MSKTLSDENILDQKLMAYADGALDAAAAAEVERLIEQDPSLRERILRHQSLSQAVAQAYAPVLDENVPERFEAMVMEASQAAPVKPAPLRQERPFWEAFLTTARERFGLGMPQMGAMAACLALGVLIAKPVWQNTASQSLGTDHGLQLSQALLQTLNERTAGAYGPVEVTLTYQDRESGSYCRAFRLQTNTAQAGVACHGQTGWQVQMLVPAEASGGDEENYRMASSPLPAALIGHIEQHRQGEPLSREQEREALSAGWRANP